jgi:hypothetical protein
MVEDASYASLSSENPNFTIEISGVRTSFSAHNYNSLTYSPFSFQEPYLITNKIERNLINFLHSNDQITKTSSVSTSCYDTGELPERPMLILKIPLQSYEANLLPFLGEQSIQVRKIMKLVMKIQNEITSLSYSQLTPSLSTSNSTKKDLSQELNHFNEVLKENQCYLLFKEYIENFMREKEEEKLKEKLRAFFRDKEISRANLNTLKDVFDQPSTKSKLMYNMVLLLLAIKKDTQAEDQLMNFLQEKQIGDEIISQFETLFFFTKTYPENFQDMIKVLTNSS